MCHIQCIKKVKGIVVKGTKYCKLKKYCTVFIIAKNTTGYGRIDLNSHYEICICLKQDFSQNLKSNLTK